jgi:hypothetical protein
MTGPDALNDAQLEVLNWVAQDCPEGRFEGYAHRVSAAALKSRGLIRIQGRGATWRTELTDKGRAYLATPIAPAPERIRPTAQKLITHPAKASRPDPLVDADPKAATAIQATDPIPHDLRGAHRYIRATRSAASGLKAEPDGRLRLGPRSGVVHMQIGRQRLHRGLALAHGMISGALRRGWQIEAYGGSRYGYRAGVAMAVREHRYPIEIHEETRALAFTESDIEKWRNESSWLRDDRTDKSPPPQRKRKEPTGKLRLILPHGYGGGRATWTDGSTLSDRLDSVFETLERRVAADDNAAEERRRRQEEWRRAEERRAEQARLRRIDEARHSRAVEEMNAWRGSRWLGEYATALRDHLPELDAPEHERIKAWCDWLDDLARRSNPIRNTSLIVGFDDEKDERGW